MIIYAAFILDTGLIVGVFGERSVICVFVVLFFLSIFFCIFNVGIYTLFQALSRLFVEFASRFIHSFILVYSITDKPQLYDRTIYIYEPRSWINTLSNVTFSLQSLSLSGGRSIQATVYYAFSSLDYNSEMQLFVGGAKQI
jgi:hypothetical protein